LLSAAVAALCNKVKAARTIAWRQFKTMIARRLQTHAPTLSAPTTLTLAYVIHLPLQEAHVAFIHTATLWQQPYPHADAVNAAALGAAAAADGSAAQL
jgi:hypothetical protein